MRQIKRVAVLGAGVMGATIAAHLANAGLDVLLLDIAPRELTAEEQARGLTLESPEVRNRIVRRGLATAGQDEAGALLSRRLRGPGSRRQFRGRRGPAQRVRLGGRGGGRKHGDQEEALRREGGAAPGARGDPLHQHQRPVGQCHGRGAAGRGAPKLPRHPLLQSAALHAAAGSGRLPPRPIPRWSPAWPTLSTGAWARGSSTPRTPPTSSPTASASTPSSRRCRHMLEMGMTVEEVDAVAGPATARPKSAAFRTADLVGIDTLVHVADNSFELLPEDEEREVFKVPDFINEMVRKGLLGNKSQKRVLSQGEGGERRARSFTTTIAAATTVPAQKPKFPSLEAVKQVDDPAQAAQDGGRRQRQGERVCLAQPARHPDLHRQPHPRDRRRHRQYRQRHALGLQLGARPLRDARRPRRRRLRRPRRKGRRGGSRRPQGGGALLQLRRRQEGLFRSTRRRVSRAAPAGRTRSGSTSSRRPAAWWRRTPTVRSSISATGSSGSNSTPR